MSNKFNEIFEIIREKNPFFSREDIKKIIMSYISSNIEEIILEILPKLSLPQKEEIKMKLSILMFKSRRGGKISDDEISKLEFISQLISLRAQKSALLMPVASSSIATNGGIIQSSNSTIISEFISKTHGSREIINIINKSYLEYPMDVHANFYTPLESLSNEEVRSKITVKELKPTKKVISDPKTRRMIWEILGFSGEPPEPEENAVEKYAGLFGDDLPGDLPIDEILKREE